MSAGPFVQSKYELDSGAIMPIRVQPETEAAIVGAANNTPPPGVATTTFGSASVSQGKRTNGVNARLVRLKFIPGGEPEGYSVGGTVTIPLLTIAARDAAGPGVGATYLGSPCTVVGLTGETRR